MALIFPPSFADGLPTFLGPTRWQVGKSQQLTPCFCFGGTSPRPPGRGRGPLHPPVFFPSSFADGLPTFWAPLGGRLVTCPLVLVFWGHIPQGPWDGATPPPPPVFAHPRLLMVRQRFESHSWRGYRGWPPSPNFNFVGGHPLTPPSWGLRPPVPPKFFPSSFAGGLPTFWVPLGSKLARVSNSPLVFILGAHPPSSLGLGKLPPPPVFD